MQNYLSGTDPISKNLLRGTLLLLLLCPLPAAGQVDLTGFLRNYNALQHTGSQELLIGRNRLRLELSKDFSMGEVVLSNDIQNLYSARTDSAVYRLREAYIDLYGTKSDLRIGRQMLVWGRAEGTFVTDILTPVDVSEFLTQDFSDLRTGVTALSWTRYFGSDFLQLVWNPVFLPNRLPEAGSRWFPSPVLNTALPIRFRETGREATLRDMQLAARFAFRSGLAYDLDVGLLYWHHPTPVYRKQLLPDLQTGLVLAFTEAYTQSLIGTYSGTLRLTDKLLLTSEAAFYARRSFDYLSETLRGVDLENPNLAEQLLITQAFAANTDGFIKERPWLIAMAGLQYEWLGAFINAQFVNEHIFRHDVSLLQKENYHYATLSLRRDFWREKLNTRIFGRYNFVGDDFWINTELTYSGIDSFELSAGAQFFGGREPGIPYGHFSFDEFSGNSFSYLKIAAYF